MTCKTFTGSNISVHSLFYYASLTKLLIHQLKYQSNLRVSKDLSDLMINYLKHNVSYQYQFKPDLIVPAPSASSSILKRGFDSTYKLARLISKEINVPVVEFSAKDQLFYERSKKEPLKRISAGIPDYILIKYKKRISIHQSNILIIDDVISTGATVLGLARTLNTYHPSKICILSIAQSKYYGKLCLKLLQREGMKHHNENTII
jgi:competence protein ComFC